MRVCFGISYDKRDEHVLSNIECAPPCLKNDAPLYPSLLHESLRNDLSMVMLFDWKACYTQFAQVTDDGLCVYSCRLQQSAEYRKWAAARGRALRPGLSLWKIALLFCVILAAAATISLWSDLPTTHVADPTLGKLHLAGQTSLSDMGSASNWAPTSTESQSHAEVGSNQGLSAHITEEDPGAASQQLPPVKGAITDSALETESSEQPQDRSEPAPKLHHEDGAVHQDAVRGNKTIAAGQATLGPSVKAKAREDLEGDPAEVPEAIIRPDGVESKVEGIQVNHSAAGPASAAEQIAGGAIEDIDKVGDAASERLVEVEPKPASPPALPAPGEGGFSNGQPESAALHLPLLAAILLATAYVLRFYWQRRELRRLRDEVRSCRLKARSYICALAHSFIEDLVSRN